jgi:hypothetical protein
MSDNEVIVTIEPELLDFVTTRNAVGNIGNIGNIGNSKPWQLLRHPGTSLIAQNKGLVAPVVNRKRRLP